MVLHIKPKENEHPGALRYTGNFKSEACEIECITFSKDQATRQKLQLEEIENFEVNQKLVTWINITGIANVDAVNKLTKRMGVHALLVEDILHVSQRSKIVVEDEYTFAVLKMYYMKQDVMMREHLCIAHKANLIITFQEVKGDVFENLRNRISEAKGKVRTSDGDYLFYLLCDAVVDAYFDVMSDVSTRLEVLEENVLDTKDIASEEIYAMRKEIIFLRNSILALKDGVHGYIQKIGDKKDMKLHYHDIEDHLLQAADTMSVAREVITGLIEVHASNRDNQMNRVMTTLTIFSAIFIPMSFLSGFFGMNFVHFQWLLAPFGIGYFILACLGIIIFMLSFFKYKRWF